MDGILCLDKPQEMTSFRLCAIARRLTGEKKAGHAGTLDPMATGVLPILLGRATRALDLLPSHDKRYLATVQLGVVSDSLDIWGRVTPTNEPLPAADAVEAALGAFRGEILQVPPMLSALKKDGVRLYDLAREGVEVERTPRPVTIYALELLSYDAAKGEAILDVTCSKGTYIRTLADDLGRALGCGAVMAGLRRVAASVFSIEDCLTVEQATAFAEEGTLAAHILPTEAVFALYPAARISEAQAKRFRNGGQLDLIRIPWAGGTVPDGYVRVYAPDGAFVGLGLPKDGVLTIAYLA